MVSQPSWPLAGRTVLVTGSSRGVGAVAAGVREAGGEAMTVRVDLTDPAAVAAMAAAVGERFGKLDLLVLNASGGMESGVDPGYALRLNRDAQVATLEALLPLMPGGSRVVFVTSHQAHFIADRPTLPAYEPVARSKRAGEDALRARTGALAGRGISLVVVSGDMIEGTITATLLERGNPGAIDARRGKAGRLPTVPEFAVAPAASSRASVE